MVWYDIPIQTKHVSKLMQSPDMHLDAAASHLKKTDRYLDIYRKTSCSSTQVSAKHICEDMNGEAVLQQKRMKSTKWHLDESFDETFSDAIKKLEVSFFNFVVGAAAPAI